ncbi:uncharacterized protein LOC122254149 [Penaeus japonicus]|uniref:uncharacterized protein LOC122254149 n=1 Tax=Penaeus japonicus TaxID=27405 RepID=UPI001C711A29|nr:uncharacterized protein LOC122254149 [Penaeus japonicus]
MPHMVGHSATLPARTRRRSRSSGRKLSQCLSPPAADFSDAENTGKIVWTGLGGVRMRYVEIFPFSLSVCLLLARLSHNLALHLSICCSSVCLSVRGLLFYLFMHSSMSIFVSLSLPQQLILCISWNTLDRYLPFLR